MRPFYQIWKDKPEDQNSKSGPQELFLWALVLLFAVTFSLLALNRHVAFETNGFDLGNVNQAIWNTAHGRLLAFTNMAPLQNRLALHVEPILFLFVPFYWLGLGGPKLLLLAQAVIVALGAWPLYLIARPRVGASGALVIGAAYLLYPALEAAVMYDFHAVTLAPTFLLFAFYWLERALKGAVGGRKDRAWLWFALFALLTMACKEDMGLTVAMLGLYAGLAHRRWKPALAIFGAGAVWSLTAVLLIQPQFAPGGNVQGDRYTWLFNALTQPGLIWEHLWNQANLPGYLGGLFAPVAGLALLSPLALLPILPSLAINLLSSHPLQWRLEEFHYVASSAPFIFIAAAKGIGRLNHELRILRFTHRIMPFGYSIPLGRTALLILLLFASLIYHYFRGFSPLARPFQWRPVGTHEQVGAEMAAQIDPARPLFAPLNLNPHVSSRRILHQDFDDLAPADWLWLDVATLPNENNIQPYIQTELLPGYTVVRAVNGFLLLKPGADSAPLPESFYTFTRPGPERRPEYPLSVVFGDTLALIGYDLRFNWAEEVQVITYWRARESLPAGTAPALFLMDGQGDLVGATPAQTLSPTLIWLPADRWPVGETIVVTFNRLTWDTRDRAAYRLGVGVLAAADPWDVGARWRPTIEQTPFANRVMSERTVVELARFSRVAGFSEGGPAPRRMRQPISHYRLEARFGEQVRLVGYNVPQIVPTDNGEVIRLDLVWQGLGESRGDYVRFVHLVGPDGLLWGQHDSSPDDGAYPTSLWAAGEFVPEAVSAPVKAGRPPGVYTLHVGLYDPASGQRLPTTQGRDHVEILHYIRW